jgi:methionine-rich copper-binding protein CopC
MTSRFRGRGRSVTLLAAVLATIAAIAPGAVLAHAELGTITPADKSTVDVTPTEIVATFTEALDPSKSSIVVVDASGATVASGGVVPADDTKKMTLALSSLAAGQYEIRWTSASAEDGDLDRGTTTFTFAPAPSAAPTPTAAPSATPAATVAATPSVAASVSPSPSGGGQAASSSTADVLIPIIVAVLVVAGLGFWLVRRRSGAGGTS